jgi:hypothetical protein
MIVDSGLVTGNDGAYLAQRLRKALVNIGCENLALIQLHDLNTSPERYGHGYTDQLVVESLA